MPYPARILHQGGGVIAERPKAAGQDVAAKTILRLLPQKLSISLFSRRSFDRAISISVRWNESDSCSRDSRRLRSDASAISTLLKSIF